MPKILNDPVEVTRISEFLAKSGALDGYNFAIDKISDADSFKITFETLNSKLKHNELAEKQGGQAGEYNHIKNTELSLLQALFNQVVDNEAALPLIGNSSLLYYAIAENSLNYWNGSAYTSIALGGVTKEYFDKSINFWYASLNELELDFSAQDLLLIEFTKNVIKVSDNKLFEITKADIDCLDLDPVGTGNNPNGVELGLLATKKDAIVEVNTTSNYIKIVGDLTDYYTASQSFDIVQSTGNNGTYTVASSSFDGTNTQINTNESITDATIDGFTFIEKLITTSYKQLNTGEGLQTTDLTEHIDATLNSFKNGDRITPYINVLKRAGDDGTGGGAFYFKVEEI